MRFPSVLSARIVPQRVYIAHAVGDVLAIGPHALEGKDFDGSALTDRRAFCRHVHLNNCALLDFHLFEGPKTPFSYFAGIVIAFTCITHVSRVPRGPSRDRRSSILRRIPLPVGFLASFDEKAVKFFVADPAAGYFGAEGGEDIAH